MDKERALEICRDRIECISRATYEKKSEKDIADETLEFLKYVENILLKI